MLHLAIKLKILSCLLCFQCLTSIAQETLYNFVQLGDYQVGFTEKLLLDEQYSYNADNYNGKKPYFIQIWHPIKTKKQTYLSVKDFFVFKENAPLKTVQQQLTTQYQNLYIQDYLSENLITGDSNNYGKHSYQNIVELIGNLKTRSIATTTIQPNNFPVIVYHNGSQGHPFENFAMAEYFASRGYIFISASFELQFKNNPFGMLPYERYITEEEEESLKTVTAFAKSLSNSSQLFFIGHSMGAQMGLRTFGRDSTIKGMVSLETSIEFKTDDEKIKELWPEVYQKVITEKVNYPFPILCCAATGNKKPFNFMKNIKTPQIKYLSTKIEFEHNAYLTLFYLRYFLDNTIQQTDKAVIKNRLPLYIKHLKAIHTFIDDIYNNINKPTPQSILITE